MGKKRDLDLRYLQIIGSEKLELVCKLQIIATNFAVLLGFWAKFAKFISRKGWFP